MRKRSILSLLMASALAVAQAIPAFAGDGAETKQLDGELYLVPAPPSKGAMPKQGGEPGYMGPYGTDDLFQYEDNEKSALKGLFTRKLARWKDPLTLPHSRMDCVKWAKGDIPFDGSYKICIGWKTQWQWMYVTAWLRVETVDESDIGGAINTCLRDAAVAAALAAIVTGGSGAVGTFGTVMKGCLASKLPKLVNVAVWTDSSWGGWE
jgi:hypothetical protein